MTRRRWIADEVSGNRAVLVGNHADHLARVLRARIGEEFDIATGSSVRRGRIARLSNDRVEFDLGDEIPAEVSAISITLALSVFKFNRMEWAIEKCAELGVSRIVPVIAHRTDSRLAAASARRVERWRRIVHEAAQQSRRAIPPEVALPLPASEIVKAGAHIRILLAESEHETTLRDYLEGVKQTSAADEVTLATGPEGGWDERELHSFRDAGWRQVSLGKAILRAETAAIAAMAITLSILSCPAP